MKPSSHPRPPSSTSHHPRPPNPPSLIAYKNMRFLVFDAPSDQNLESYIKEFEGHHVTDIVRVCEPTYDKTPLERLGIKVYDWSFTDGEAPPDSVVSDFLALVARKFETPKKTGSSITPRTSLMTGLENAATTSAASASTLPPQSSSSHTTTQSLPNSSNTSNNIHSHTVNGNNPNSTPSTTPPTGTATIGVHCVAGLGRAPVLVAMALIEGGMAPLDSVIYIRERRRGAINARQLKYLEAYKKKSKDKSCVVC